MKFPHCGIRPWRLTGRPGYSGAWITGLALAGIASLASPAWGQSSWPSYPNNSAISVTSSGNVGIGTTSPMFNLHTRGIVAADQGDNVYTTLGIDVGASSSPTTYAGMWYDTVSQSLQIEALSGGVAWRNIVLQPRNDGNVGIGTTSPQHLLHVAGTIGAEEVIVSSTGADYVFDPGYKLQPLSEVADYIKENHHLPDIPSAAEMKEKGANLGEMQTTLLAKIEELTLHQIQLEQQNKDLQQQIRALQQQVRREGRPSNNDGGF